MDIATFWPNYFLLIGVALAIIIGAWWAIVRLRDLLRQPIVVDDTVNPTVDDFDDDPEPVVRIIRRSRQCRWRDVSTKKHGKRKRAWRSCPA